ncbi:hypothetical protein C7U60_13660 [Mesorhizobium plurifarium]|uniref:tyrosine-type recombinase/integrase n=1 Tax=Sinorhizobium arboris TaxID=76745 RepID=UPI000A023B11|nr:hypothetical protein C7U60_13660 [Mesorhizobium plurifarium]
MRCCAAGTAPHRNPPLPPRIQQPKTAGANSKLDKTWGQGQEQKKRGTERLFPDLRRDSRGYYSDGFQKWFSRLLEKQSASEERTSFHSFRHNWRDAMRNAGVPQERVRLIGGWKRTATDEQYGSNLPLQEVRKEIAKITYAGVKSLGAL